jgi:TPR repeat protein
MIEPQAPVIQHSAQATEPSSANLPAASDKTPSPQIKGESPGSLVPLTQVTRPPAPAAAGDNSVEPGQPEYLKALQILRSPGRSSEVPAAIQLLWAAVEKGNIGAEVDLAELFRTGQRVAKNCDQARILLSAAARKGSAEARKRLEALQRQGCGN